MPLPLRFQVVPARQDPRPVSEELAATPLPLRPPPAEFAPGAPSWPCPPQRLVRQARAGEAAAFACLYDLHWRLVHGYFQRHLGPCGDLADDLTADVFVEALDGLRADQADRLPFSVALYRIAHARLARIGGAAR